MNSRHVHLGVGERLFVDGVPLGLELSKQVVIRMALVFKSIIYAYRGPSSDLRRRLLGLDGQPLGFELGLLGVIYENDRPLFTMVVRIITIVKFKRCFRRGIVPITITNL